MRCVGFEDVEVPGLNLINVSTAASRSIACVPTCLRPQKELMHQAFIDECWICQRRRLYVFYVHLTPLRVS